MKKSASLICVVGLLGLITGCTTMSSLKVITGTVTDVDGNPISGAIVTTTPPTSSVSTDKDGRYIIKTTSKDGKYSLKVNKLGYASSPSTVFVHGGEFIQGDIQLVPEEMMPVPMSVSVAADPVRTPGAAAVVEPAPSTEAEPAKGASSDEGGKEKNWWDK